MDHRSSLVLLGLLLAAGRAAANDSAMGGVGSDLVPLDTTDVTMVSEDIQLTWRQGEWHVEANYVFRNAATKKVALQVGFPEYRCDPSEGDCVDEDFRFEGMRTEVRGMPVVQRTGRIAARHAWAPRLGRVWLFNVAFAPGETVPVRHTYKVPSGQVVDGTQTTTYVTRTGATWAGPIGSARFRLRVPLSTTALDEPAAIPRKEVRRVTADGVALNELVYEARDWEPAEDLAFAFLPGYEPALVEDDAFADAVAQGPERAGLPEAERCQSFLSVWRLAYDLADPRRPQPTAEQITAALATGVNSLAICRHAVRAVYGNRFQDDALNRYFYGEQGFVAQRWPPGFMRPNAEFHPQLLTAGDYKTLELFDRLPRPKAAAAPPPEESHSSWKRSAKQLTRYTARRVLRSVCSAGAGPGAGSATGPACGLALAGWLAVWSTRRRSAATLTPRSSRRRSRTRSRPSAAAP